MTGCDASAFSEKRCELANQASTQAPPIQVSAVLAPTSNFVNFESIIRAAESSVKDDLGSNLPDERLEESIGSELSIVVADGVPQLAVKRTVKPLGDAPISHRCHIWHLQPSGPM